MLDDDAGRLAEALHALQRSIGIGHVVIGQLLALQLGGGGDAGLGWLGFAIEGGALVGIFPVAHVLGLDELGIEGTREGGALIGAQGVAGLVDGAQVVGDHAVIGGSMLEGLERQIEALGIGQAALLETVQQAGVIAGIDHDGDILVVLGRRADHGRTADVDILDGIGQGATGLGHGRREGVEVDHHHVDRLDAVLGHDRAIQVATTEDTAMDLRMQRLHPTVHHFREAGVIGDFHSVDGIVPQQFVSTAGGQDFHAQRTEFAGEIDNTGLVRDTDQRAAYRQAGGLVGHLGSISGW